jgi:hypothetical protein
MSDDDQVPYEVWVKALDIAERVSPGSTEKWLGARYVERTRKLLASAGVPFEAPPAERREAILAFLRAELHLPPDADHEAIRRAVPHGTDKGYACHEMFNLSCCPGPITPDGFGRLWDGEVPVAPETDVVGMAIEDEREIARRSAEGEYKPVREVPSPDDFRSEFGVNAVSGAPVAPTEPAAGAEAGAPPESLPPSSPYDRARTLLEGGARRLPGDLILALNERERSELARRYEVKIGWSSFDPEWPGHQHRSKWRRDW